MDQTKQTPKKRNDRPWFPFVLLVASNLIFGGLFLSYEQIPVYEGSLVVFVLMIIFVLLVFTLGIVFLTTGRSTVYNLCNLGCVFFTGFVGMQYLFAELYWTIGLQHSPDSITHNKWDALYFSIITWTTTGYGDFVPTVASRWVACCEALLGTLYNGFALAVVIYQLNLMAKPKP